MNFEKHIFDVGAFNGVDGLALALKNPSFLVHAFEANPDLISLIKKNKIKIEKYKKIKIRNYRINNLAVSDKVGKMNFNIAKNPTVSSLNKFTKKFDSSWLGYKESHFQYIKKISIKVITLEKYCLDNDIRTINYLHIDTQGSDLKVLKGLKNKINILKKGVLEAAVSKKKSLYQNNHTVNETKKFLLEKKFIISKIENIDRNILNEKNIFFTNKKNQDNNKIKLNNNLRYFNRIISNRINFKDKFIDNLKLFFNF